MSCAKPPHYTDESVTLYYGDCLDVLRELPDASIDSVVTDPPYGLAEHRRTTIEAALQAWLSGDREHVPDGRGFMGRDWDRFVPPPAVWDECFRVLKPGGHLLAFAGTRTVDLMGISIRLAGLTTDTSPQIRDSIAWLYGSGFPKSLDVSKAIDRAAGAERQVIGHRTDGRYAHGFSDQAKKALGKAVAAESETGFAGELGVITEPATEDARRWQGWGTALKPAFEPIIVARKPFVGTVAGNVLQHGTGALNIDACRVPHASEADLAESMGKNRHADFGSGTRDNRVYNTDHSERSEGGNYDGTAGRWPPNVAMDPDVADGLDQQAGDRPAGRTPANRAGLGFGSTSQGMTGEQVEWGAGGASRYFPVFRYEPKAPTIERPVAPDGTTHPTVKPLDLIRWLVRLVTPPGGLVLDPFAGSGTTAEACLLEGMRCILVENWAPYLPLILQRLSRPVQTGLFAEGLA